MGYGEYLQEICKEKHIRKTYIAYATGISADYLYKIFKGIKCPKERDYMIAICRAMGMNITQTQTALQMCGMERLNYLVPRDGAIIRAIGRDQSVYMLNLNLEDQGFKELKVRDDI